MVVAYHLGGLLGAWVGIAGSVGIMAQSEMGGISGFLLYFRVFIALTHEWTDLCGVFHIAAEHHAPRHQSVTRHTCTINTHGRDLHVAKSSQKAYM